MIEQLDGSEIDERETTGRRMDPELRVMAAMLRQLDELEEPAKRRVMAWLASRYEASK